MDSFATFFSRILICNCDDYELMTAASTGCSGISISTKYYHFMARSKFDSFGANRVYKKIFVVQLHEVTRIRVVNEAIVYICAFTDNAIVY